MKTSRVFCRETPADTYVPLDLPWPITPGQSHTVEVCRWFHEPTEDRNLWEWVYEIQVTCFVDEDVPGRVLIRLRACRKRQDYLTKKFSFPETVTAVRQLPISQRLLQRTFAPRELVKLFDEVATEVRQAAARGQTRYQSAMDQEGEF